MIKTLIVLLAVVSFACALDKAVYREWKSYVAKYNRKFLTDDHSRKSYENFADSYTRVTEQNKRFAQGLSTYTSALNEFSDKGEEAIPNFTGLINIDLEEHQRSKRSTIPSYFKSTYGTIIPRVAADQSDIAIPSADYSNLNTIVRNQGNCGSCYAHAAAKTVELNIKKYFNASFDIAPQQIVDCSYDPTTHWGNNGCNGGIITNVFDFLMNYTMPGKCLVEEKFAPYTATLNTARNCKTICASSQIPYRVTGYEVNYGGDFNSVKAILKNGPAFAQVYVDAEFQSYSSGIFKHSVSSANQVVNHAVTAVGFGTLNGVNYIDILNSWGPAWGNKGFIRVDASSIKVTDLMARPIIAKI